MNHTKLPPALRFIESPVILCVWSDTALNQTYDAGQQVHDARMRRQNNNYWSFILPRNGKPTQPWLIFNMSTFPSDIITKLRDYVTYSYEMVLLRPPHNININTQWLHDGLSRRGFELLTQYTGSMENATELLQRVGLYDSFLE
jgi:hypothetical protein